ncbi:hypothetical protein IWQ62_002348 [Dispira parvispora]|uniref:Uncharacterized protein n=1 Tax=Dispira parvispora TaxID=1520584 RepID=A0A9W8AW91_9FUNG|nr:hypothetical protein IWQ62_002348 [Dispira parvispora]
MRVWWTFSLVVLSVLCKGDGSSWEDYYAEKYESQGKYGDYVRQVDLELRRCKSGVTPHSLDRELCDWTTNLEFTLNNKQNISRALELFNYMVAVVPKDYTFVNILRHSLNHRMAVLMNHQQVKYYTSDLVQGKITNAQYPFAHGYLAPLGEHPVEYNVRNPIQFYLCRGETYISKVLYSYLLESHRITNAEGTDDITMAVVTDDVIKLATMLGYPQYIHDILRMYPLEKREHNNLLGSAYLAYGAGNKEGLKVIVSYLECDNVRSEVRSKCTAITEYDDSNSDQDTEDRLSLLLGEMPKAYMSLPRDFTFNGKTVRDVLAQLLQHT